MGFAFILCILESMICFCRYLTRPTSAMAGAWCTRGRSTPTAGSWVPVMMLVPVIPVSRTDCEQRSQQRCRECIDTNLCTRSLPTRDGNYLTTLSIYTKWNFKHAKLFVHTNGGISLSLTFPCAGRACTRAPAARRAQTQNTSG